MAKIKRQPKTRSERLSIPEIESFCREYLKLGSAPKAYIAAFSKKKGFKEEQAVRKGADLLRNPDVKAYIKFLRQKMVEASIADVSSVFKNWVDIATADVNEIVAHRRTCCRYCWGIGGQREYTPMEFAEAQAKAMQYNHPQPDPLGGTGFDKTADPNIDCVECKGEGIPGVHQADTRKLQGKAKALYSGVKMTAYGPEIVLSNREQAWLNIARHLGMLKDRLEISGTDGSPLDGVLRSNDPIEAAKAYQDIMQGKVK